MKLYIVTRRGAAVRLELGEDSVEFVRPETVKATGVLAWLKQVGGDYVWVEDVESRDVILPQMLTLHLKGSHYYDGFGMGGGCRGAADVNFIRPDGDGFPIRLEYGLPVQSEEADTLRVMLGASGLVEVPAETPKAEIPKVGLI